VEAEYVHVPCDGVRRRRLLVAALGAALLAGCATQEYKSRAAISDMQRLGVSREAATCVVQRLRDFYSQQYIAVQRREVARRHLDPSQAAVNPQAVDLYVRNKLAGQDNIGNDEKATARAIARRCGVRGA